MSSVVFLSSVERLVWALPSYIFLGGRGVWGIPERALRLTFGVPSMFTAARAGTSSLVLYFGLLTERFEVEVEVEVEAAGTSIVSSLRTPRHALAPHPRRRMYST